MSPTSYQAAPPRDRRSNLDSRVGEFKLVKINSFSLSSARRVRHFVDDAVENLLVTTHHPEFLSGDSLLSGAVGGNRAGCTPERIDLPLQRIGFRLEPCLAFSLPPQIEGAVFPALHREHQSADDYRRPD